MTDSLNIGKASKYIGRSPSYLRQLEQSGVLLPDEHTAGGHRRYSLATLDQFLSSISTQGVCLTFLGIPDADFPAEYRKKLQPRLNQILMGMGFIALEDFTPSIYEGGFYSALPKILTRATDPDVTAIAFANHQVLPLEAFSAVMETCLAHSVRVHFLSLQ